MPLRIQILNKGVRLLSLAINNQSVRIKQVEEFKKIAELGATNDMAQFAIKQSVQKGLFRAPVDKAGKIRQLKKQEEISDTIQTYIGFIRKFPIVGVLVSPILNTFESAFKPKLDDYYQELDPSELEIM